MKDKLKTGDTVWTIEYLWIEDSISIPTHIKQQIVMTAEVFGGKDIVKLMNGVLYNIKYGRNIYLTEDEALKTLQEERKQFLTNYPNDWKKIVEELQQLLKEQSND